MALTKEQIIDNANKLLQKGQVDKAIAEYRNALKIDPKNIQIRLKVGDLLLKMNKPEEAVDEFLKAGSTYISQGFYPKAIAVYKQILRVDPSNIDANDTLAQLYQKIGLAGEAVNVYRTLLGIYEKQKNNAEAVKILKKITEIDPSNLSAKVKLGEIYYHSNKREEGAEIFKSIYEFLAHHKREEDMLTILDRWLNLDPNNLYAIKNICAIYLKKHEPQRMLLKLQSPLKEGIKDPEILVYLAESYILLNKKDKAIPVYKELARLHLNQGDNQSARRAYEKVLEINPNDVEARNFIKPSRKKDELEIEILEEEEKPVPPKKVPPPPPIIPKVPKRQVETKKEDINKRFIQAEIYMKFGIKERAAAEYENILAEDPRNIKALNALKDLYPSIGKGESAVKHLITLSEIAQENGELEEGIRYLEEALTYQPDNKEILEKLKAISPESIQEEPLLDELAEAEARTEEPKEVPVEVPPDFGIEETTPSESAETSFRDVMQDMTTGTEKSVVEEQIEPPPLESEDLQEQFDEVEFYVQQGLTDEAVKILKNILEKYPDNETAKNRLKELQAPEEVKADVVEEAVPVQEESVAPTAAMVEEGEFDLAKELESELVEEGVSLQEESVPEEMPRQISAEEVLREFKSKVATVVSDEDADTHYDLGIAYKEMGLIDEAISEFNVSSASPHKAVESYNMIGLCYRDKGNFTEAEKYFKLALQNPDITKDFSKGVLYDLARVYEENGEVKKAIEIFEKIVSIDSNFRDVSERLTNLKSMPEKPKEDQSGRDKTKRVSYI
jgi:tetratricopeptide (TPR) repeat protein